MVTFGADAKNSNAPNYIFEVNQKRDLTSFKRFTAPEIKTSGIKAVYFKSDRQNFAKKIMRDCAVNK